ncbi:MAG TPA: hypothetical protein VHV31_13235 [Nitrolancea sp.]|nr:hypothetical protein [Nitrolancea sp.]
MPFPHESAITLLGVGAELPFARTVVKSIIGAIGAELLLSGLCVISLCTTGNLTDPLQVGRVLVGLTSPLIQVAVQPLLGPVLAELVLGLAGIALVVLLKSRNRRSLADNANAVRPTILPQRSSIGTQLWDRLPA